MYGKYIWDRPVPAAPATGLSFFFSIFIEKIVHRNIIDLPQSVIYIRNEKFKLRKRVN